MAEAKRICSIPGCDKAVSARGWCSMHYERWRIRGTTDDPVKREPEACSVERCGRRAKSKGMCNRHYENVRNYGYATPVREWPIMDRLEFVGWDVTDSGCWEWRGSRNDLGYGFLSGSRVHRLMWEVHNGPITEGLVVRHRCDNPPCLRPDHLDVGTQKQNMQDMTERGRSLAYSTGRYDGVCVQGRHDVTQPGSLKRVAKKEGESYMTCVECDRERKRKHHEKRKAS